ncbi:hypothetical protein BDZ89DRAFT_1129208 [Hymenopellis radicata]|nr:hypothetical protein BDZ89DRAFT_1129208 [Hymenopellis radicata]
MHTAVLPEPSSSTRLDDSPAVLACSPTSLSAAHSPSRHAQHIAGSCSSSRRPKAPENPGKHSSPAGRSPQDALALTSKLVSLKPVKKCDAPVSVPYNVATDAPVDASAFTVRREPPPGARTWRLPDYVAQGYRHIRWIPDEDRWVEGTCIPGC